MLMDMLFVIGYFWVIMLMVAAAVAIIAIIWYIRDKNDFKRFIKTWKELDDI